MNGDLEEDVDMSQTQRFKILSKIGVPLVCKLKKALYGLK